ncbi:MAG TPA: endo-1,4-beta-xylanase [Candidatus Methylacidiphilales bacterium]|jgi:GH35 family endo-1,4-beta-xylanase|nr:endo-1,4-beta-xylanase [Candidatus Methylacidiphilales bacterium]
MKTKVYRMVCLLSVVLLAPSLSALGQTSIIPSSLSSYTFTGTGLATGSIVTVTPPAGASFTQAWDIKVTAQTSGHDVTIGASINQSVAQGDALVAILWYRRIDGLANEANLVACYDTTTQTSPRSLQVGLRGRNIWRSITVPFIASAAATSGNAHFFIECGATEQEVQIGGMQLLDYGQKSVLSSGTGTIDCTSQFALSNQNGTWGTLGSVAVSGNAFFSTADQVKCTTSPGVTNGWELSLWANLQKAVTSGDTLVALFWMQRDSTSNQSNMGISGYKYQLTASPFTNVINYNPLMVEGAWQQFYIPFTSTQTFAAGASQFQLWFGAAVQTLDVGGIQVIDLGPGVTVASLNNNQTTYPGRGITEAWQTTAAANIAKYRMGNLTVNVQNASGSALSGATVTANMQKHHFGFSSAFNWAYIIGNPGGGQQAIPQYENAFSQYSSQRIFNKANMANYKWPTWEQSGTPALLSEINQWFRTNGIVDIRAHNLIWPNFRTDSNGNYIDVPQDVPALSGTAMSTRVNNHINAEVPDPTVHGLVNDWDVVNEPWDSRSTQDKILGVGIGQETVAQNASVITTWLSEVATDDPAPYRLLNDDGVEINAAHIDLTEENYDYSLITTLIGDSALLDGYNFESHFLGVPTPPVTAKQIFDRFATLTTTDGYPLKEQVTEYDTEFTDPYLQADYLADYLTLVFSEPNFDTFSLWGFWGGDFPSSVHNGSDYYGNVYDTNWNLTPSGEAWMGLVFNKWWTNTSAVSNTSGVATINGFLGRYALTASTGSITKIYYADLPTTAGASVNLKLGGSGGTSHVWLYEAENSAAIYAPFYVAQDPNALNGEYVTSQPGIGPGGVGFGTPPATSQMRIDTEASGTVNIWVRVIAPNPSEDSFWTQIDSGSWAKLSLNDSTTWYWYKWTQTTLSPGVAHVLNFGVREGGAQLDQILITDDLNFSP